MFDADRKRNDFKFVDGDEMPFETILLIAVVKSKMHVFVSSEIVCALRELPSQAESLRERIHTDYSCNYADERKVENGRGAVCRKRPLLLSLDHRAPDHIAANGR